MKKLKRKKIKAKLPKKPLKKIFFQEWGTYKDQTLVAVGVNMAEILSFLKKKKVDKESIKAMESWSKDYSQTMANSNGFFCQPSPNLGNILWLKKWDTDDWGCYEVLVHELFHAVYNVMGKSRGMMDEQESMAYQQEHLFNEIRRKLNKK